MNWKKHFQKLNIIPITEVCLGMKIRFYTPFSFKDDNNELIGSEEGCGDEIIERVRIVEGVDINADEIVVEFNDGGNLNFAHSEFVEVIKEWIGKNVMIFIDGTKYRFMERECVEVFKKNELENALR